MLNMEHRVEQLLYLPLEGVDESKEECHVGYKPTISDIIN